MAAKYENGGISARIISIGETWRYRWSSAA